MEFAEGASVKSGDLVQLVGGVTPLIIVSVSGATAFCAPLPYRVGEPAIAIPVHQLRPLREMPTDGPTAWASI
jgi:hypothetical protein